MHVALKPLQNISHRAQLKHLLLVVGQDLRPILDDCRVLVSSWLARVVLMVLHDRLYGVEDHWEQGVFHLTVKTIMNHACHCVEKRGQSSQGREVHILIHFLLFHFIIIELL